MCGVVPSEHASDLGGSNFSPRMRGCSRVGLAGRYRLDTFPAHAGLFRQCLFHDSFQLTFPALAGLFLRSWNGCALPGAFPRVCGVVPTTLPDFVLIEVFSPHSRGCSAGVCYGDLALIFPAFRRGEGHTTRERHTRTPHYGTAVVGCFAYLCRFISQVPARSPQILATRPDQDSTRRSPSRGGGRRMQPYVQTLPRSLAHDPASLVCLPAWSQ